MSRRTWTTILLVGAVVWLAGVLGLLMTGVGASALGPGCPDKPGVCPGLLPHSIIVAN